MKTRSTVFVAAVAAIILVASFVMVVSDDSSAADPDFSGWYYKQLNTEEKKIYDAMNALNADTVEIVSYSYDGVTYYRFNFSVTVTGISSNIDTVLQEARNAWLATKLTNPMAWWTWSFDDPSYAVTEVTVSSDNVDVWIRVADSYCKDGDKTLAEMVGDTEAAIAAAVTNLGFTSSTTTADKIKAINEYLCGSGYKYDPAVSSGEGDKNPYNGTVYGAFVNTVDGKHVIVCSGYSAAFQALCDGTGVKCLTVFGTAAGTSSNVLHAWNEVVLGSKVYAVDTTFNATGTDKTAYLCVGAYTAVDGLTFSQSHQPFVSNNTEDLQDSTPMFMGSFHIYAMNDSGYHWPAGSGTLAENMAEYAPWIIIGLICALLAYVLFSIGRKGGQ